MARRQGHDRVGKLVGDVEAVAKRLRADVRKRAREAGILKQLQDAAAQLRKRAALAAAQVEKYVHQIRKDLEDAPKKASKRSKPKPRSKKAAPASAPMTL